MKQSPLVGYLAAPFPTANLYCTRYYVKADNLQSSNPGKVTSPFAFRHIFVILADSRIIIAALFVVVAVAFVAFLLHHHNV